LILKRSNSYSSKRSSKSLFRTSTEPPINCLLLFLLLADSYKAIARLKRFHAGCLWRRCRGRLASPLLVLAQRNQLLGKLARIDSRDSSQRVVADLIDCARFRRRERKQNGNKQIDWLLNTYQHLSNLPSIPAVFGSTESVRFAQSLASFSFSSSSSLAWLFGCNSCADGRWLAVALLFKLKVLRYVNCGT
jgi:hypothetical protein